jgi:PKD repeat protein
MEYAAFYPKFEADQVLTADQLNDLTRYLNNEIRITRNHLSGIGIISGLEISTEMKAGKYSLHINAGIGITTDGYIIRIDESDYTQMQVFSDDTRYFPVPTSGTKQIYELLKEDPLEIKNEITPLRKDLLDTNVILLFFDIIEEDTDTCAGGDCDQRGIKINHHIRVLMVSAAYADTILNFNICSSQDALSNVREFVNDLTSLRPLIKTSSNTFSIDDLYQQYQSIIERSDIINYINLLYGKIASFIAEKKPEWLLSGNYLWEKYNKADAGKEYLQYLYDHIRDLIRACNELNAQLYDFSILVFPIENAFPQHLFLGQLSDVNTQRYRQPFVASPIVNNQKEKLDKIRFLFKRICVMVESFTVPLINDVRITPGGSIAEPLGKQSIPFYYQPRYPDDIRTWWSYEAYKRGDFPYIPTYHYNTHSRFIKEENKKLLSELMEDVTNATPEKESRETVQMIGRNDILLQYSAEHAFFRIEGHIGRNYPEVNKRLQGIIHTYNLPIKIKGLSLVPLKKDAIETDEHYYQDLNTLYLTIQEELDNLMVDVTNTMQSIRSEIPKYDYKDSPETKISGIVKDEYNTSSLPGTEIEVVETGKKTKTKPDGSFTLGGLSDGTYTMKIFQDGYASKEINVIVESGKELQIGDVEMRSSQYVKYAQESRHAVPAETSKKTEAALPSESEKEMADIRYAKERGAASVEEKYSASVSTTEKKTSLSDLYLKKSESEVYTAQKEKDIGIKDQSLVLQKYIRERKSVEPVKSNSIGEIAQKELDVLSPFESAESYLYKTRPKMDVDVSKKILDHLYHPIIIVRLLNQVRNQLNVGLLDFDLEQFLSCFRDLLNSMSVYKKQLKKNTDTKLDNEEIIAKISLIENERGFDALSIIYNLLQTRMKEMLNQDLFSAFIKENPGISHCGGVQRGGTFILLYDDSSNSSIVADFCLPYYWQESRSYEIEDAIVRFKLPNSQFCKNDASEYRFILDPPGGDVSGPGIRKDKYTADYYFQPSREVIPGDEAQFFYRVDGIHHTLSVSMITLEATFTYTVKNVSISTNKATIAFASHAKNADSLKWNFEGQFSTELNPEIEFDVSEKKEFTVTLTVYRDDISNSCTQTVVAGKSNALFTILELIEKREDNAAWYQFSPVQESESYEWNFGDDSILSTEKSPVHRFNLVEGKKPVNVVLTVKFLGETSSCTQILELPPRVNVVFKLEKNEFCTSDTNTYTFITFPPEGEVKGPGVTKVEGKYVFKPSEENLEPGPLIFVYTKDALKKDFIVTLIKTEAIFNYIVKHVDCTRKSATVIFDGTESLGKEWHWSFGDEATSREKAVEHRYDISKSLSFSPVLTVSQGECRSKSEKTITFEPISVDFKYSIVNNGDVAVLSCIASDIKADSYTWDFGNGVVLENASYNITHSFPLDSTAKTITVTLRIEKSIYSASVTNQVVLPAKRIIYIKVDKTTFCYTDEPYPIAVSPAGGIFTPNCVVRRGDAFYFDPKLTKIMQGTIALTYTVEAQSTSVSLMMVRPVADFLIKSITPNVDKVNIFHYGYIVEFENRSTDANSFLWKFDNGILSREHTPKIVFERIKPGLRMPFVLEVSWNGAGSNSKNGILTFPIKAGNESLDNTVFAFINESILKRKIGILNGSKNPLFEKLLTGNAGGLLTSVAEVQKVMKQDFANAASRLALKFGERNRIYTEMFNELSIKITELARNAKGTTAKYVQLICLKLIHDSLCEFLGVVIYQYELFSSDDPLNAFFEKAITHFEQMGKFEKGFEELGGIAEILDGIKNLNLPNEIISGMIKQLFKVI